MADFDFLQPLVQKSDEKILLLVLDGVGDLPSENGQTPLERARTPHFDELASRSSLGLLDPVGVGITPGSGPGHLALFGYNPRKYFVGRGVLAALGVGFPLQPSDVAARINFCTLDSQGNVVDRRAGRIPTEECVRLVEKLQGIEVEGVQCFVVPVREYRAALILRGPNLSRYVNDTDPQRTGVPPLPVEALREEGAFCAKVVNQFVKIAQERLADEPKANGILLRGFEQYHPLPSFSEVYQLKGAAIAVYPMYRGVSRLVGLDVLDTGNCLEDQWNTLEDSAQEYDFVYLHVKQTDRYGEDGNFAKKVEVIEEVDKLLPRLQKLPFSVIAVTGDHSTPVACRAHSWHPVPLLLSAPYVRYQKELTFCERHCARGDLGRFPSEELMPLLLAHSGRLRKFGA